MEDAGDDPCGPNPRAPQVELGPLVSIVLKGSLLSVYCHAGRVRSCRDAMRRRTKALDIYAEQYLH
uniref:Uncharacterized protein n=1 Tax=Leersia perrieri TaxID=77586 RepID=A0A0D9XRB5_9ORYZ